MSRKYGFVTYTNIDGHIELISSSMVSMIYRDDSDSCYIVLFNDGTEIILDLSDEDAENLIKRLLTVDSL